jgi:hypothetical protein
MTSELANALLTMRAKVAPQIPERKTVKTWKKDKKGKKVLHVSVETSEIALSSGHFGLIFPYLPYRSGPTVLKLQRFENVHKSLDIYSHIMEMLIGVLIQSRGLECTSRIVDVVRTEIGDVGAVISRLQNTVYHFFLQGPGAKNYKRGLLILIEIAEKLYRLQKCFNFRHRDFRMKNIMLTTMELSPESVRIIDLGKTSITFQGENWSAYSGVVYEHVSSDFDLSFLFGDFYLHLLNDAKYYKQLQMYEPILVHFLQGVRLKGLVGEETYLARLMERVHLRPPKTKKFSTPEYVYRYLENELETLSARNGGR